MTDHRDLPDPPWIRNPEAYGAGGSGDCPDCERDHLECICGYRCEECGRRGIACRCPKGLLYEGGRLCGTGDDAEDYLRPYSSDEDADRDR